MGGVILMGVPGVLMSVGMGVGVGQGYVWVFSEIKSILNYGCEN